MIEEFEAGKLPEQDEWNAYIDGLRKETVPSSKELVTNALIKAVEKRVPKKRFGLLLSGGVDSCLLALLINKFSKRFHCYSVGIKSSKDVAAASIAARKLCLKWKCRMYSIEEIEQVMKKAAGMFEKPDVVKIGVASVVLAAAELARKDGIKIFFSGLGSEEIFAGYRRHKHAKDVNDECWRGLKEMWKRDLARDMVLEEKLGVFFRVPFLDGDLIKAAMGIPGELKISKEHKKIILREIAEELGLPKELAWRQKLAAQYGSGFDKAMEKLAKKNGMTKTEYVESLRTQS